MRSGGRADPNKVYSKGSAKRQSDNADRLMRDRSKMSAGSVVDRATQNIRNSGVKRGAVKNIEAARKRSSK